MQDVGNPDAAQPQASAVERRLRYLKIGAAAVGGGALMAITGSCLPACPLRLLTSSSPAHSGSPTASTFFRHLFDEYGNVFGQVEHAVH